MKIHKILKVLIGTLIPKSITGSILFIDSKKKLAQDNINLFWDEINARLGIGTGTPAEQLQITKNFEFPSTTSSTGQIKQNGARIIHSFGSSNLFIGKNSANLTLTGASNLAIGEGTLQSLTSGSGNLAIGINALFSHTTGSNNSAIGGNALIFNTTGNNNFAIGVNALFSNTIGTFNSAIGINAGATNTIGDQNTYIGSLADSTLNNISKSTAIGYNSKIGASNVMALGGLGVDSVKVGINTSTPSAMLELITNATTEEGIKIKGTPSQTGDLIIATDSSDNIGFKVQADFDVIIGSGAVGKDYTLTFNGESNDGIITYMEDEDRLDFDMNVKFDANTIYTPSAVTNITAIGGITVTNTQMRVQGSGGAITITANPQISAGTDGQYLILHGQSDTNTVTISDGSGVHLHSGASVTLGAHDYIVLSYASLVSQWHEVSSNFTTKNIMWSFVSPSGSSGIFYFDGFYQLGTTDNNFNPSITFGTINSARAAHFFLVQAAGGSLGTDTVVRITGTSITDAGVRTATDIQDLTVSNTGVAGTYYETTKKWLGQITIAKVSGPDILCNYGFVKYWDNNNSDFRVKGLEVSWLGGANDSNANLILRHHKPTGWTYNAGATPTIPAPITDMQTDYNTEINIVNGENGSWKRDNLNTVINGSNNEGIIVEILTSANKTFELGNFLVTIRPN